MLDETLQGRSNCDCKPTKKAIGNSAIINAVAREVVYEHLLALRMPMKPDETPLVGTEAY